MQGKRILEHWPQGEQRPTVIATIASVWGIPPHPQREATPINSGVPDRRSDARQVQRQSDPPPVRPNTPAGGRRLDCGPASLGCLPMPTRPSGVEQGGWRLRPGRGGAPMSLGVGSRLDSSHWYEEDLGTSGSGLGPGDGIITASTLGLVSAAGFRPGSGVSRPAVRRGEGPTPGLEAAAELYSWRYTSGLGRELSGSWSSSSNSRPKLESRVGPGLGLWMVWGTGLSESTCG